MIRGIDRSFLTRLLRTTGLSLALMMASAAGIHAQVIGADGANGADGVNPGDPGLPGGDGESVSGSGTVMGGNGGGGGNAAPPDPSGFEAGNGGNGGNGGAATATGADANAVGGNGGPGGSPATFFNGSGGSGGAGGSATALATGSSGTGNVTVSASATGGNGGLEFSQFPNGGDPGAGGDANATADALAGGGGTATANAVAEGGIGGDGLGSLGAASATSNAETANGAMAAASTFGFGSSGEFQSTAMTSLATTSVHSTAMAPATGDTTFVTTNAIAQGGSGQPVPNDLFQTTFAFSTALPDKAYAATLIGAASNVADALLGPSDKVFGTAILGEQGIGDSASSTFDFRFRGDLLLGLIGEFSISANGDSLADSFVGDDSVINLGSNFGPNIDLTVSGSGIFVIGGSVVPEPSTWAMMVLGFAGLGFAGYRRARPTRDLAA